METTTESTAQNAIKHFKKIVTHKYWVAHYCFQCGLYSQGILHDMSKFSPTEFFESVKYYRGISSPNDAAKKINGYSMAWIHHRGRNLHHYEAWTDNYDQGTTTIKMPFRYALEMICDYLGAGRAYTGTKFSMENEMKWWKNKREVACMHEDTKKLIDVIFECMMKSSPEEVLSDKQFLMKLKHKYEFGRVSILNFERHKANE